MATERPTEIPANYQEAYNALMDQMTSESRLSKKHTKEEIELMVKDTLIQKALDKVNFTVNSARRHGAYRRYIKQMTIMGNPDVMSEQEYYEQMKDNTQKSLTKKGYVFSLNKEDQVKLNDLRERHKKEAVEEATKISAEALKKILLTS